MPLEREKTLHGLLFCILLTTMAGAAEWDGGQPSVDKSAYHLFNPTPSQYLRDMTIDGPGRGESPYTVDAGHFQVEMSLVSYSAYKEPTEDATYRLEFWAIAPMNLKIGLFNRLDLQVVLEPFDLVYEHEDGYYRATHRGLGDTTLRVKYNLWGNDNGWTALAVMPHLKFPTAAEGIGNGSIEGGLIFPFEAALPRNVYIGLVARFEAVRNFDEPGYHTEFGNSITLRRDFFRRLFGYVEFYSAVSTGRDSEWVGTFDTGLSYTVTKNLQLNGGVNIGVTRAADQWNPFIGLAWRF